MQIFSERLRNVRKARNITQKDLAESVGVTTRVVQYYEAGEKQPTIDVAARIAATLDTSLDYLTGLKDDEQR